MNIQKGAQMEELLGSAAQRLRFHPRATPRVSFEGPGTQLQFFAITLDFAIPYFHLHATIPKVPRTNVIRKLGPSSGSLNKILGARLAHLEACGIY